MEDDEWDLTAEEMDSLERDAILKIAEQNSQSQQQQSFSLYQNQQPPFSSRKVQPLPSSTPPPNPNPKLPKLSVKFFLHDTANIAAKFSYNPVLVNAFRNVPKATWNSKERLWIFPLSSLPSAEKLLTQISGFNVELDNLDLLVKRAIAAAFAVPDLREWYNRIPHHVESKLLPFQRDGVRFVLQHGGRALLADEMGLGKTLQAIAVTACVRASWPVLVLTPSSLRLQWASMIQEWLDIPPSDILVVLSQWSGSNKAGFSIVSSSSKRTINLDGLFNIISYDAVPKFQNMLMTSDFRVVIADESHYLKNAQAKRTTASLPIIKKAQYAILLSGTPALSRPIELFKQLAALYPDVYKNVHEYGNRYCKGGIFGTYQGASNREELHNLMKATLMIRRLKKDVLSELPTKRRQQVFLELSQKDMKQVNALFRELEVLKGKIKGCTSKEEVESLKFSEKNLINKIYTESSEAKIPGVLDYLGTVIETTQLHGNVKPYMPLHTRVRLYLLRVAEIMNGKANCKFLVFAHHQSMIDAIHEFLLKKKVASIRIDGNTPAATRQALVTDFQEKDTIKAAVLSIKAGGVGLTLTAASTVIFAELSWTPGDLIQAEDRAHRIGQVTSVNIYYLLANDTVDDIIWDVVQSKLENLGQVLDGHENTLEVSDNQQRGSPMKQKMPLEVSAYQQNGCPSKQKTLDSFLKRCNNSDEFDQPSKVKHPRL